MIVDTGEIYEGQVVIIKLQISGFINIMKWANKIHKIHKLQI